MLNKGKCAMRVFARIAAAALAFVAILVALSMLFYPKDNQEAHGMIDEAANGILGERSNSIDVIFIGDSETYSAFSPLQMWGSYGFTSYVCSTSGQKLPYGNTLLRRATIDQKPRIVVFETNFIFRAVTLDDVFFRWLQDIIPAFEYHNRWKALTPGDLYSDIATTWSDDMKGFYLDTSTEAASATSHMAPSDQVTDIPLLNRLYLETMVDYCRSIGAEPIFVSTPSTVNWNTARHDGIQLFADEIGVAYIDLNTEPTKVDIDWKTDTRDKGDHLNLSGALKTSDFIGRYFSEVYKLPDHRKDDAYSSWNELFELYQQKIAQ